MNTQTDNITGKYNILYTRVSTISQEDNTSLDYQKCNLLSYCNKNSIPNYLQTGVYNFSTESYKWISISALDGMFPFPI